MIIIVIIKPYSFINIYIVVSFAKHCIIQDHKLHSIPTDDILKIRVSLIVMGQ